MPLQDKIDFLQHRIEPAPEKFLTKDKLARYKDWQSKYGLTYAHFFGAFGNKLLGQGVGDIVQGSVNTLGHIGEFLTSPDFGEPPTPGVPRQPPAGEETLGKQANKFFHELSNYHDPYLVYYQKEYKEKYEPMVNQHMALGLFLDAAQLAPTLALMAATGGEGGAIMKNLGFSEALSATRTGKIFLGALRGYLDGNIAGLLQGKDLPGMNKQGEEWAAFAGALGILANAPGAIRDFPVGKFAKENFPEISEWVGGVYANLSNIFGGRLVRDLLFGRMSGESMIPPVGVPHEFFSVKPDDPIIRKLDDWNKTVLDKFSQQFYDQPYEKLNNKEKKQVNLEINKVLVNGYKYPAVFDDKTTAYVTNKEINEDHGDPSLKRHNDELNKQTKQSTGSTVPKAAADGIRRQTEQHAGKYKTKEERIKDISKAETPEQLAKAVTDKNTIPLPKEGTKGREPIDWKNRIVPGAARKHSPEFTEETFMRFLSTNEHIESPAVRDTVEYWKAKNGRGPYSNNARLRNKVIRRYEAENADLDLRMGKEQGLVEHAHKLFVTGHLGKNENVFRSGNYMVDELRDRYKMPKTQWQHDLDKEYLVTQLKDKNFPSTRTVLKSVPDIRTPADRQSMISHYEMFKQINENAFNTAFDLWKASKTPTNPLGNFQLQQTSYEAEKQLQLSKRLLLNEKLGGHNQGELSVSPEGAYIIYVTPDVLMDYSKLAALVRGQSWSPFNVTYGMSIEKASPNNPGALLTVLKNNLSAVQHSLPALYNMIPLMEEAESKVGHEGYIMTGRTGYDKPMSYARETLREELAHRTQRTYGLDPATGMADIGNIITPIANVRLESRIPQGMASYLTQNEYTIQNIGTSARVGECAAKFITQPLAQFNTTPYEAARWLDEYFTHVYENNGADAIAAFKHAVGIGRTIRDINYEFYKAKEQGIPYGPSATGIQKPNPGGGGSSIP